MPAWWSNPSTKHAYVLAWVSVIITIIAAAAGIAVYEVTGSALILCYGLENMVDFLSSVVVLWRFFCPDLSPEVEAKLMAREKRASISISVILGLLGVGIITTAVDDFTKGMEDFSQLSALLGISLSSILVFGLLSLVKFHYSILLKSASLHKDGICSLIGTILSIALFINTLIIRRVPEAWWIDPAVALGCGVASLAIGVHALFYASCVQKIPICSYRWWMFSQGDGTDEINGRELDEKDVAVTKVNPPVDTVANETSEVV
mmetsp:Transcript_16311/g.27640  ORF Transcript_16311/g.27640 Transcript_16311/m.27640 type:complete len:262 (+) Transcript_16311:77-862(+)|eukprot:CAMPEP_0116569834 /NCGR_PEP_ID=MMETSP0397-20121206/16567_1 /TAXON_ID=216820 /ORGANISM="Cyclophora tenuis, Strain ECT3854" /LENGTH=261 /DNA_ID=CAMNT_0004097549 /DNA_START=62 /DNA_END=847 /DNA_ORIENTATION=-